MHHEAWYKADFRSVDEFQNTHFQNCLTDYYLANFDYEKTISQLNDIVGDGLETIFLISAIASAISSRLSVKTLDQLKETL